MQVDQPTPYTRARYDTSSEQPHAPQSYSFPPPPSLSRTASATDDHPSTSREYAPRPQSSEGNFSYAAPPPGHHHSYQSYSNSSESQQPRTLAGFADVDEGLFPRSVASGGGGPGGRPESTQANPGEYSQLGRTVVQGGNVGRTLNSYQFAGYMSGDDAGGSQFQPHPRHQQPQQHQSPYAQPQPHPQQYSRYQPFSTSAPGPPSYAIGRGPAFVSALNGAPLEWAKPRMSQDDSAIGLVSSHRFGASSSSTPSHTSRSGFATPGAAAAPQPHSHSYYSPYQGPPGSSFGMVRSTSNQSTISESTTASSSHLSTPGELTSDYEGHDINPSYLGQGYFANVGGAGAGDSGYYSSTDVHGVSGLRLDGVSPASTPRNRSPARTSSGRARSSRTVRASSTSSTARNAGTSFATANGHKEPKRRTASTIFHPSPQSMLAPGATSPSAGSLASLKGRGLAHFPGTNSPALPTDEEFASMPTKRSRGRRPPCTPDLDINLEAVVDPNEEPTEAQLAYAGVTKTGKAKKIFLCKVPGCGKCFKRSEHLKRHVRSIHTHERPFQCQWPGCARYFSRHDNLNQHLRIHREPGVSDEAFSAELKRHFNRRLTQVQQEVAQAQSRSPSVGAGEYEGGEEGMGAGAGGEEEHEVVEERKPAPRKRSTRSRSRSMRVRDDNSDGEGDDEDDGDYVPGE